MQLFFQLQCCIILFLLNMELDYVLCFMFLSIDLNKNEEREKNINKTRKNYNWSVCFGFGLCHWQTKNHNHFIYMYMVNLFFLYVKRRWLQRPFIQIVNSLEVNTIIVYRILHCRKSNSKLWKMLVWWC